LLTHPAFNLIPELRRDCIGEHLGQHRLGGGDGPAPLDVSNQLVAPRPAGVAVRLSAAVDQREAVDAVGEEAAKRQRRVAAHREPGHVDAADTLAVEPFRQATGDLIHRALGLAGWVLAMTVEVGGDHPPDVAQRTHLLSPHPAVEGETVDEEEDAAADSQGCTSPIAEGWLSM
jgi:hypothetical protein